MAFPVAGTQYPDGGPIPAPPYSGTFIPEIWSAKLVDKFYDATVVAAISNTDYEGEIRNQGDKVIIRQRPDIVLNDYEAGAELTYQRPSAEVIELLIDKGLYWNTILDDVMEVQSDIDQMNLWAQDASEQMKIKIDDDVLATITADIPAYNQGATAGRISGNVDLGLTASPLQVTRDGTGGVDPLEVIVRLGQVLDETNTPETGRWVVIPAWFAAVLKLSDLKSASIMGDATSVLRNGMLGTIDRFTIYVSHNLPRFDNAGEWVSGILAGHSRGLTFASQITNVETLRAESTFGNIMRGLNVYGYKVTIPDVITLAKCVRG